jgi:hypothetical protein
MIKDIYVYFSDRDYFREVRDNPYFVHPHEYDVFEYANCSREEFGKLKLANGLQIRLIFDSGREIRCPWCGYPQPEIKNQDSIIAHMIRFFAECPRCLARGPTLNVNRNLFENTDKYLDEYKELVRQRWTVRIPKSVTLPSGTVPNSDGFLLERSRDESQPVEEAL